jgi:sirohydrochlorin cobaltochelatase
MKKKSATLKLPVENRGCRDEADAPSMIAKPESALVLVGHGSTLNPDSSQPTHEHAGCIRRRGVFAEVHCAFWKEEPYLREVLRMVESAEVYVVPNFISEGYFTTEVIPRELRLLGKTTVFPRQVVHYCDPVGLHPSMTKLLLKRAAEVAPGVPRAETSLVIVGHGTGLNENSTKAIKDKVALIRGMECGFAEVLDAYMEEPPLVSDWLKLTACPNVVVVPFFIADGLHSWQDIPVLLGIEKEPGAAASEMDVFRHNPYELHGRRLFLSSAIGTEPLLADVILDQVEAFDAAEEKCGVGNAECGVEHPGCGEASSSSPSPFSSSSSKVPASARALGSDHRSRHADDAASPVHNLSAAFEKWLAAGGRRIGEVVILSQDDGSFLLRHEAEAASVDLARHTGPEAARELARYDAAGKFRPLKTAPTLRRGWEIAVPDTASLRQALDFLYPAAVANWWRWLEGEASAPTLRETLGRQTGIYRVTALIRDEDTIELVGGLCGKQCLRHVMWSLDGTAPWPHLSVNKQSAPGDRPEAGRPIPLLCFDTCPLLVGAARSIVRKHMKAAKEGDEPVMSS